MSKSKMSKMGFTLIELMVVIVIIGVLASLAIPRFTEASDKAKVAEAPRILASYESAALAQLAEKGEIGDPEDLIFNATAASADSKWFNYGAYTGSASAAARKDVGKILSGTGLMLSIANQGTVTRTASPTQAAAVMKKYVPNFFKD
jgi:prepilin-type N-terminal cleavage/methylation domain-containing protein